MFGVKPGELEIDRGHHGHEASLRLDLQRKVNDGDQGEACDSRREQEGESRRHDGDAGSVSRVESITAAVATLNTPFVGEAKATKVCEIQEKRKARSLLARMGMEMEMQHVHGLSTAGVKVLSSFFALCLFMRKAHPPCLARSWLTFYIEYPYLAARIQERLSTIQVCINIHLKPGIS